MAMASKKTGSRQHRSGLKLRKEIGRDQAGNKFRDQVLKPRIDAGLVEMTIRDKPQSSKYKYRLAEKGKEGGSKNGTELGVSENVNVSGCLPNRRNAYS
jgi:hypothetical protein